MIEERFVGVNVICVGSLAVGTSLPEAEIEMTIVVPPDKMDSAGEGGEDFISKLQLFLSSLSMDSINIAGNGSGTPLKTGGFPLCKIRCH